MKFSRLIVVEAMQFTYENREEFLEWATRVFGVSSRPMFLLNDAEEVVEGHVWLGRRGDDRDTKISLNHWAVEGHYGAMSIPDDQFHDVYQAVEQAEENSLDWYSRNDYATFTEPFVGIQLPGGNT